MTAAWIANAARKPTGGGHGGRRGLDRGIGRCLGRRSRRELELDVVVVDHDVRAPGAREAGGAHGVGARRVGGLGLHGGGPCAVGRHGAEPHEHRLGVVGVNIGKSRVVPVEHAVVDYVASARRVAPFADYLVVNVSSPNTPGLRDLQSVEGLRPLLIAVRSASDLAAGRHVPLLVKIAPDLADADILAVADLGLELGLDGIVETNTTTARARLLTPPTSVSAVGPGGLSGEPLRGRSIEVLRLLRGRVRDALVLVSVGGIGSAQEAACRLQAGATLIQAYTGFVYGGPLWPRRVTAGLLQQAPSLERAHR